MITLQHSLLYMYLKEAVVKFQGKEKDIVSGVSIIMPSCDDVKKLRQDVDAYSHRMFELSSRLAKVSSIPVSLPRISGCQQHRSNPEHVSVADYFNITITIPFLGHLVSDTTTRFTAHSKKSASIQELFPKTITPASCDSKIEEAVAFYTDDLSNPTIIDEEFCQWKSKWLAVS